MDIYQGAAVLHGVIFIEETVHNCQLLNSIP